MKKTHRWMLFFLFLLFLLTIPACTKKAEKIVFYQTKESEITKHVSVKKENSEGNESNKESNSLEEFQDNSQTKTDQSKLQSDLQSNSQPNESQLPSIQTTTVPETIAVYLCGEVVNPGVYLLDAGSRLYQAVELSGGLTDQARAEAVNLARVLTDSEQIYIPNVSEAVSQTESSQANGLSGTASAETLVRNEVVSDFPVNINQATVSDLMKLPGIGQVKAEAIVTYREANGSFSSIEEIKNVPGIKEAAFEKIKGLITVF